MSHLSIRVLVKWCGSEDKPTWNKDQREVTKQRPRGKASFQRRLDTLAGENQGRIIFFQDGNYLSMMRGSGEKSIRVWEVLLGVEEPLEGRQETRQREPGACGARPDSPGFLKNPSTMEIDFIDFPLWSIQGQEAQTDPFCWLPANWFTPKTVQTRFTVYRPSSAFPQYPS